MASDPEYRDRVLQLLSYLSEIGRLKAETILDVGEYEQSFWLYLLPDAAERLKFPISAAESSSAASSVWLTVQQSECPVPPPVPDVCSNWVDPASILNLDEVPIIRRSISSHDLPQYSNLTPTYQTLYLTDFPEVAQVWQAYLDDSWRPWAATVAKWHQEERAFKALFDIYNDRNRLGTEYELVLGLGLLQCRPDGQAPVKRHVVTITVQLEFDAESARFQLEPASDGWCAEIESDMLEATDQPCFESREDADNELRSLEHPWQTDKLRRALLHLFQWTNEATEGRIEIDHLVPREDCIQTEPVIDFAPALLLRRRSNRTNEAVLHQLRQCAKSGVDWPVEFQDLCELYPDRLSDETLSPLIENHNIYLPKSFNDEQISVLRKLNESHGVLVLGPPGTGKTHTIANIVSHLLAMGQRVLVTAKSPRALAILRDQLPPEVRPLCIHELGDRDSDQQSLQNSVSALIQNHDQWNEEAAQAEISSLKVSIQDQVINRAAIDRRIRAIRDAERRYHEIVDRRYTGTAAMIARQVAAEADQLGWLSDDISEDVPLPITGQALRQAVGTLAAYSPEERAECDYILPNPSSDLPPVEMLADIVSVLNTAEAEFEARSQHLAGDIGQLVETADWAQVKPLARAVGALYKAIRQAARLPELWVKQAIKDVLSGNELPWRELFEASAEQLQRLGSRADVVDTQSISKPDDVPYNKLLLDAVELRKLLSERGKLTRSMVSSQPVKGRRYVLEQVKINDEFCNNVESLSALIEYLSVQKHLSYLWKLWRRVANKSNTSLVLQVAELTAYQQTLEQVLALSQYVKNAQAVIDAIPNAPPVDCGRLDHVEALYVACRAYRSKLRRDDATTAYHGVVSQIDRLTTNPFSHPVVAQIYAAVLHRDVNEYATLLSKLSVLSDRSATIRDIEEKFTELLVAAPRFAEQLLANLGDDQWAVHLTHWEEAWAHTKARTWLRHFLEQDDLSSCEREAKNLEDKIRRNIGQLGAQLAWSHTMRRIESPERDGKKQLVGWQQAVARMDGCAEEKKPKYQREVQRRLRNCRETAPAWVMPLHQFYENADLKPGMFDVVIVDEASQCGLEALPLLSLGKRMLVVGDDHQISPEPLNISSTKVNALMDRYLADFDYAASFSPSFSLFDHAKQRFRHAISLREHFRSMPEIIGFSNKLCYDSAPLMPLRRGYLDRLPPLRACYVGSGCSEESGSEFVNRQEAEQLVDAVVACINDERYDARTFCVISLQGKAQAQLIESMLFDRVDAKTMADHRLQCGTPSDFQGDERDVVFLTMVVSEAHAAGVRNSLDDIRQFNVAATRARDQMWLFHSVNKGSFDAVCVRHQILDYFDHPVVPYSEAVMSDGGRLMKAAARANRVVETPPHPFANWFEIDVVVALHQLGYRVLPKFPAAASVIDLVVEGESGQLGIICDSDNAAIDGEGSMTIAQQRVLERCGWQFFRLLESVFYADSCGVLERLREALDELGIKPQQVANTSSENSVGKQAHPPEFPVAGQRLNSDDSVAVPGIPSVTEVCASSTLNSEVLHGCLAPMETARELLALADEALCLLVVATLRARRNNACPKEVLSTLMLKQANVRLKGNDRQQFDRQVQAVLPKMEAAGLVDLTIGGQSRVCLK